ncbi:hypothetical protein HW132_28840 [Brasilonema sp. CT11]|nr:hypothetical protein [Brasilonema sp. CT11]
MKRNLCTTALCGGLGLFGGLFIATGAYKDLSKSLSIIALATLPTGYISYVVAETRAVKRINEAKGHKETAIKEASDLYRKNEKLGVETAKLNQTIRQLELDKKQLDERVKSLAELLAACQNELLVKNNEISNLQAEITTLQSTLTEHQERVEELQAECDEWDKKFFELVEKESQEKFKIARDTELQKIFDEHDAVNQQFQNIIDRTMIWADKVRTSHANKNELVKQMSKDFNETLDTVGSKIKEQEQTWLAEIELLREKVAVLQQQNVGEILEPEYLPRDFNRATDISNGIAHVLRHFYNVSLRVNGFEETEELLRVGYAYSKSLDPKKLVDIFDKYGKDITKSLGLYSISATVDKISPTFVLTIKTERPKPESDEDIYKQGLIPASQFSHQIFLATDHTAKGKPTMRVMSSTGGGKGIAVKNVLAYFAELNDWEVWLSDPVDGSEEDYWNCPKIAKSPGEAGKAYQQFTKLHRNRQKKESALTDKYVLGVFDEFDRQHDDDDKEIAKTIMTAIRHTKQRQILIGQSGEVGENHWTWDAMNNCSLLFIENAIGTAIKHDKDLGWSLTKKREIQKKYEKFSQWAQLKNEAGNIPNENAYRIALLVIGDRYSFLEIPSANKGIIRSGKAFIRDTFDAVRSSWTEISHPDELTQTKIVCPHCASDAVSRNGKNRLGEQLYSCKVCDNKPKKWVSPNSN